MKIDMLVPPLDKAHFSGGTWCLMQYAVGLANAGHDVRVVPMAPSPYPEWAPQAPTLDFVVDDASRMRKLMALTVAFVRDVVSSILSFRKQALVESFLVFATGVSRLFGRFLPFEFYRAHSLYYLRENKRETDVVIATFFETALAARFYPAKRRLYFCQHLETLFYKEMVGKELSRIDAEISYQLGLEVVVNSTWLKDRLQERGLDAKVCCNAISHEYFSPEPVRLRRPGEITLVSYGGRNVDWKGFVEMAKAVSIARNACPDLRIVWRVYGSAALPPDNDIAAYESLGFLQQSQLGDAYRSADILLSASWYESFPLFPLEAMSCGLPVIVTQPGTEDFSRHLETAYVVKPRDPQSIAEGIIALARDEALRQKIAQAGLLEAQRFTWEKSISRMREIIEN